MTTKLLKFTMDQDTPTFDLGLELINFNLDRQSDDDLANYMTTPPEPERRSSDEDLAGMVIEMPTVTEVPILDVPRSAVHVPRRFPTLSTDDIDGIIGSVTAKNTIKATKCHVDVFKSK